MHLSLRSRCFTIEPFGLTHQLKNGQSPAVGMTQQFSLALLAGREATLKALRSACLLADEAMESVLSDDQAGFRPGSRVTSLASPLHVRLVVA